MNISDYFSESLETVLLAINMVPKFFGTDPDTGWEKFGSSRIRNAENSEFRDSKEIVSQICQNVETNFVQLKHSRGKSRICPEI
jgi:hypothetical protein